MRLNLVLLAGALLVGLLAAGCGKQAAPPVPTATAVPAAAPAPAASNAVAAYLDGAELQAETQAQRRELRRALAELLDPPAAGLRAARYAGLDGSPAQRTLPQVLRHHLVPDPPRGLDDEAVYTLAADPATRAAVQRRIDALDRAIKLSE